MVDPNNIANPRLTDAFGIPLIQESVDFAIPHLKQDLPLYVDPFLLWASTDPGDRSLHDLLLGFIGHIRELVVTGEKDQAFQLLRAPVEPRELGLGYASNSKQGRPPGPQVIQGILAAFEFVPQLKEGGLRHLEELQMVVPGFAEDGISDVVSAVLRDYLIDFTAQRAREHEIPTKPFMLEGIYDPDRKLWRPKGRVHLPYNPLNDLPLLFAPLRFLRHLPWINYEDYYRSNFAPYVFGPQKQRTRISKNTVLRHNREHYRTVERYVDEREAAKANCHPDPLFNPLTLATLRKKFEQLRGVPTGKTDKSDRAYEDLVSDLLSTLLYPRLEFAESRVRTVSGAHIRDLIFYNDGKTVFLKDIRDRHDARQPVCELKNVKLLETEHVNQLWRYLGNEEFGKFGVLVTRNPCPTAVSRNIVDLHSGKQGVILTLDDSDIELMINMYEAHRDPSEVLKKRYLAFTRQLPQ